MQLPNWNTDKEGPWEKNGHMQKSCGHYYCSAVTKAVFYQHHNGIRLIMIRTSVNVASEEDVMSQYTIQCVFISFRRILVKGTRSRLCT